MNRVLPSVLLVLAAAAAPAAAPALEGDREPPPLLVRAGTVVPVEGDPISPGAVLCRGGKIVAVGTPAAVGDAAGARVLDLGPGSVLVPGLVAVASGLAAPGAGVPESVAPEVRAIDGFDWFRAPQRLLEGGVTTAYLDAGRRRVVGGQGAVVKLAGASPEARTLLATAGLFGAVGDPARNPPGLFDAPDSPDPVAHPLLPVRPQSPGSRMAAVAMLREALARGKGAPADAADPALRALADAAAGRTPVRLRADDAADLRAALALARETGIRLVVGGARDAGMVADELKAAGVSVALESPWVPGRVADPWDPEEAERLAAAMGNPAALEARGVPFAIGADDAALPDLMMVAAAHVGSGLSAAGALRAVTLDAARILGVDARVGSLREGKDADLVVFSGDPLDARSSVVLTVVDGTVVFRREPAAGVTVIRAGVVHTGTGVVYAPGAVAVEGGRIVEVGPEVGIPPGASVLDRPDGVLLPGFVDGHTRLGLRASNAQGSAGNLNTRSSVAEALVPDDPSFAGALGAGVTTALVTPGGRGSVVGSAAVVKTGGGDLKGRILSDGGIEVSLAGVPDLPASLQGLRDTVSQARKYHESWEKYGKDLKDWEKAKKEYDAAKAKRDEEEKGKADAKKEEPKKEEPKKDDVKKDEPKKEEPKKPDLVEPKEPGKPGENASLEGWRDLFRGKGRIYCRAASAPELLGAVKVLKEEAKLELVLVQADEAWRVAPALKRAGVGVLLGPRLTFPSEGKVVNAARALLAEGVLFGFATDAAAGSRELPLLAAWAVRNGLGAPAAVRALTLDAARVLGVDDRVGSLEPGKDADLVLLSGDPFRASTRVRAVWIGGKAVFVAE